MMALEDNLKKEQFKEGDWVENPDSEGEFDRFIKIDEIWINSYNGGSLTSGQNIRKVEEFEVKTYFIKKVKEYEIKHFPKNLKSQYFRDLLKEYFGE